MHLILSRYFKISDIYINLDTDKVIIHFLIFRVSSISYNNINIDSTSKIAESEVHEHVIQDFEHSLLTQQIFEGLVYQIWLIQNWSLSNHTHQEGKTQNINWYYINDLTDEVLYRFYFNSACFRLNSSCSHMIIWEQPPFWFLFQ